MTAHATTLESREDIAEGTMGFHFVKPANFHFKPGQAIDVILDDAAGSDEQNGRHAFSIVSAPSDDELMVATRMRDSAFKRALESLPLGASMRIDGPFGSLTLHKDRARPAVLIAGGIGITPFMSILRNAAEHRLPHALLLLYSNRRPEDAAFLAELQQLERKNPNFRLLATMTQMDNSARSWEGETTQIDDDFVKRAVAELSRPIYYLVGPPGMVAAMRQTLERLVIDDDDIRSEEFYGY